MRLLQRYAVLETEFLSAKVPSAADAGRYPKSVPARKLRKEADNLKAKIGESTQQEQLMLLRLGEIWLEVQNRERWMLAKMQAQQQSHSFQPPFIHHPGCYGQPKELGRSSAARTASKSTIGSGEYHTAASVLSPLSPSFVPGAVSFRNDVWSQVNEAVPTPDKEQQHNTKGPDKEGDTDVELAPARIKAAGDESDGNDEDENREDIVFSDVL